MCEFSSEAFVGVPQMTGVRCCLVQQCFEELAAATVSAHLHTTRLTWPRIYMRQACPTQVNPIAPHSSVISFHPLSCMLCRAREAVSRVSHPTSPPPSPSQGRRCRGDVPTTCARCPCVGVAVWLEVGTCHSAWPCMQRRCSSCARSALVRHSVRRCMQHLCSLVARRSMQCARQSVCEAVHATFVLVSREAVLIKRVIIVRQSMHRLVLASRSARPYMQRQ